MQANGWYWKDRIILGVVTQIQKGKHTYSLISGYWLSPYPTKWKAGELSLSLTSCNSWESRYSTSSGQDNRTSHHGVGVVNHLEGIGAGELALPLASWGIKWASWGSVGDLNIVAWVKESCWADKLSYHPDSVTGLWVNTLQHFNIYPVYEQLEHMTGLLLQTHSFRSSMTQEYLRRILVRI